MARFIRWQGIVAFFVLSALVAGLLYLFAESLVKAAIVRSVESAFGAEVNVREVELSYSPLQISVLGLQVTDKEMPSHNVFSFARASAGVDVFQYLFGKIIIEELTVSELEFSSVRTRVGEVYINDKANQKDSLSDKAKAMLPDINIKLPDVKTLLNDSNLLTVQASNQLNDSYKTEQEKIKVLQAQLPNKAKLTAYQDQVKALGNIKINSLADIEKIKTAFEKIKAEFKADQAIVNKAKQQVIDTKTLLTEQVNELKAAPTKDWQQIEQKYQLESIDTGDFAHIIFGEKARDYVEKAQWAYDTISPLMANMNSDDTAVIEEKSHAKGRFIFFKEEYPLPSVLIKKALFSVQLGENAITIKASELTNQHWLRGKDSLININSVDNGELKLTSHFNLTESGDFNAAGQWLVNDRTLSNTELTQSKALTLSLIAAQLDGKGNFTLKNNAITATNHLSLEQASYEGEAKSTITKLLLDTVKSLDSLTLDVGVNGKVNKPSFTIASSLNDALTGAVKQQLTGKLNDFKGKVNKGLNEKLATALKLGKSQTAELLDVEALLTDTDNALSNLANSDIVKQQQQKLEAKLKDKAKNKIKDKLKGKLSELFG